MHYFIDGYNLMFRILRAGDNLQQQRESIIHDLGRKIRAVGLDATLVFDAQYQSEESSRSHIKELEIYFTDQGESADDFILKQLRLDKNPQRQIVVTSDKKLAWLARRKGAQTETVEDFLRQLNNRFKNRLLRSKSPSLKEKPATPPKKELPAPATKSSPDECSDYYLTQFEAQYQEWLKQQPEKKIEKVKNKKSSQKPRKAKREEGLTDEERWMNAFERDLNNDKFLLP